MPRRELDIGNVLRLVTRDESYTDAWMPTSRIADRFRLSDKRNKTVIVHQGKEIQVIQESKKYRNRELEENTP
jgi:hypothetical protein